MSTAAPYANMPSASHSPSRSTLPHNQAASADRFLDEMHKARALVVTSLPTTRHVLAGQLRDLGVGHVSLAARLQEARGKLEASRFDIVLCEDEFPDENSSGQQLLDDLRQKQLLPLSTVFIMITSQATYAKVAEAAESALDSYLLRPHNTASLAERLGHARRRKAILRPILEAVDTGRLEEAADLCMERFTKRGEYWLYAARIGAELLLNLNRHEQARELFDAVLEAKTLPWAKLGVARTQIECGEIGPATRTLESLILEQPTYVDAYDVLGRAKLEQGDFDGAMEIYRRAVDLTPSSLGRLQKSGMLAYYRGEYDEAAKLFERAINLGISSKLFDWQTAVLLAFARFKQRDTRGLQRCADDLASIVARVPKSARLRRFHNIAQALLLVMYDRKQEVASHLKALREEVDAVDFDIESASNVITLLSLLSEADCPSDESPDWIDRIARRHTGAKIMTELLVRAAHASPLYAERVRAAHLHMSKQAEQAMSFVLSGQHATAIQRLLQVVEETLNSKLLETARMSLQRYRDRIADTAELDSRLAKLDQRVSPQRSPLVETNGRKPGALVLRNAATQPTEDVKPTGGWAIKEAVGAKAGPDGVRAEPMTAAPPGV
jgi:tetratricopeptide (TPR) repeat protein